MTVSSAAIDQAAQRLWDAEQAGATCPPVRDLLGVTELDAAYTVQQVNVERHQRAGRRISGRKIGLTAKVVQEQQGVHEPDFGTLFADTEYGHGSMIPAGTLIHPRVEAEIALVLGSDLDHDHITVADVVRATDFVMASLEVVDCRIDGWDIRITDTISDNAAAGAYVLGTTAQPLLGTDLAGCAMTLQRNGVVVSSGRGEDSLGHPLNAAVWLARTLHRLGTPLQAGEVILSGALGPMVEASPGDHFEARIDGLGAASVTFEADNSTTEDKR